MKPKKKFILGASTYGLTKDVFISMFTDGEISNIKKETEDLKWLLYSLDTPWYSYNPPVKTFDNIDANMRTKKYKQEKTFSNKMKMDIDESIGFKDGDIVFFNDELYRNGGNTKIMAMEQSEKEIKMVKSTQAVQYLTAKSKINTSKTKKRNFFDLIEA